MGTVKCPFCGEIMPVADYRGESRTDVLSRHLRTKCPYGPQKPEEGPPAPRFLHAPGWPWKKKGG